MSELYNFLGQLNGYGTDGGEQPGGGFSNLPQVTAPPVVDPMQAPAGVDQAANVLQMLNGPAPAPQPDPSAAPAPQPAPAPALTPPGSIQPAAPRERHSILDTIGKISDVLAKVGGAQAQYQPNLDAATARANAITDRGTAAQDHAQQVDLNNLKIATTKNALAAAAIDAGNTNKGKAIQAIQAIQEAHKDDPDGGVAAISKAWPIFAQQAGLSSEDTAHIGGIIAADPSGGNLDALDRQYNGIEEYDTTPLVAINRKTGEQEYVQAGKHGGTHVVDLGDGFSAAPANVVTKDLGGVTANIDARSGKVLSVLKNTESPDTAANVAGRANVAGMQDASRESIAASAAAAKAAKGGLSVPEQYNSYVSARAGIIQMRNDIQALMKNPNLSTGTGFLSGAVDTPARQAIEAKIAGIEGQATGVSVGMLRAAGAKNPGQREVLANAKGIISDLHLLRQSTGSFQENAQGAVDRLNARLQMMDQGAQRAGYANSGGGQAAPRAAPAPAAPVRRILPAPSGGRPTQPNFRNW